MKAREVIKKLMEENNVSNADIAHSMNMSLAASWDLVANPRNPFDMSTKKLCPLLNVLGYKLVAMPREDKLPKGGIPID